MKKISLFISSPIVAFLTPFILNFVSASGKLIFWVARGLHGYRNLFLPRLLHEPIHLARNLNGRHIFYSSREDGKSLRTLANFIAAFRPGSGEDGSDDTLA